MRGGRRAARESVLVRKSAVRALCPVYGGEYLPVERGKLRVYVSEARGGCVPLGRDTPF